jgi:hypothetical protein
MSFQNEMNQVLKRGVDVKMKLTLIMTVEAGKVRGGIDIELCRELIKLYDAMLDGGK